MSAPVTKDAATTPAEAVVAHLPDPEVQEKVQRRQGKQRGTRDKGDRSEHGQFVEMPPDQRQRSPRAGGSGAAVTNQLGEPVLAAYLSDARLNILACLNDVRVKTGLGPIDDDEWILSALESLALTSATPEDQDARMRLLRERFPFINPMTDPKRGQPDKPPGKQEGRISDEKRRKREQRAEEHARDRANEMRDVGPEDFQRCLRRLFDLVRALRNATVHPTTVNEDPPTLTAKGYKDLYFGLAKVYEDGLRVVATRFGLAAKTIEPACRL